MTFFARPQPAGTDLPASKIARPALKHHCPEAVSRLGMGGGGL